LGQISISLVDGFSYVDKIGWDNYNEYCDLIEQIQSFKKRFGHYPEAVLADKIYRTRENRKYCNDRNIRMSGAPLGRPKKVTTKNKDEIKKIKKQRYEEEINRISVGGKFGQGKRRFSLALIMSKLAKTSETTIMISFIVMNLEKILKDLSLFAHILLQLLRSCLGAISNACLIDSRSRCPQLFSLTNKTQPIFKPIFKW